MLPSIINVVCVCVCVCVCISGLVLSILWFSKLERHFLPVTCVSEYLESEVDLVAVPIQRTLPYLRKVLLHLTQGFLEKILQPSFPFKVASHKKMWKYMRAQDLSYCMYRNRTSVWGVRDQTYWSFKSL